MTGTLTLDAQFDPNAVFIFQIGSTLTTASNSSVVLINGAQNCNVFWQVGSSATLGTGTVFVGNILALTKITLTTGAGVSGRTLAQNGAVTLDTNAVAVANCAVVPPVAPTISKAFVPATIDAGGPPSTLTITLSNADSSDGTGAAFTDTLPPGVVIANLTTTNTCGGGSTLTIPATGMTGMIQLTGGTIPHRVGTTAGGCTVTVNVTAAAGIYLNTIPAGALTTSNGPNAAPAVATLAVNSSVTLSKDFSPAILNLPGFSTLTITLGNNSGSPATLAADLTDNLPSGMTTVGSPSTTCVVGVPTKTATSVTLPSGSTIQAGGCTVTVNVTGAAGASYLNELPIGALQTIGQGSNIVPASAALVVNAAPPAPTLSKAFSLATINAGGSSTLTITLINPSSNPANLATTDLIDTLPTGVQIATSPNATNNCGGGLGGLVANPNGTTVTLLAAAGNSIPATSFCTVTVDVTTANAGIYLNTIGAGALVTSEGSNVAPASATLAVIDTTAAPPTLSKFFSPPVIHEQGEPPLTITLCNPNSSPADLIAPLTDTLPDGVVIAATPNASTTCPGSGPVAATASGTTVILPLTRSIPISGCCTVTVDVIMTRLGVFVNTLPVNALQTTNGNNIVPASATLTVDMRVPMLSGWAMVMLIALLALVGFATMRREAM